MQQIKNNMLQFPLWFPYLHKFELGFAWKAEQCKWRYALL